MIKMDRFLRECDTGDIVLYSHVRNVRSPLTIFKVFDGLIRFFTGSQYTHCAMVVKDPTFGNLRKGIYLLESNWENFADAEDDQIKCGVQLVRFDDVLQNVTGKQKLFWRKLECERDDAFRAKMRRIHRSVHDKPYDLNPFDWMDAVTVKLTLRTKKQFWCSALLAYVFVELGFLDADLDWSLVSPAQLSCSGSKRAAPLKFIHCNVLKEIEIVS